MRQGPKKFLLYVIWIASITLVAIFVQLLMHEVVGHLGVAWLLGADIKGFEISIGKGGFAYFAFDTNVGPWPRAMASGGGIALNLTLSLLGLWYCKRWKSQGKFQPAMVAAVIAAGGIFAALRYVVLGSYYSIGDPASVLFHLGIDEFSPLAAWWVWLPTLIITALLSFLIGRLFFRLQAHWWPQLGVFRRGGLAALSVGTGLAIYIGLGHVSNSGPMTLHSQIWRQNQHEITERQLADVRRIDEENPLMTPDERKRVLNENLREIYNDVTRKQSKPFPIMFVFFAICVSFGTLANSRVKAAPKEMREGHAIAPLCATTLAVIATSLTGLFSLVPKWSF